jgi:peptidoglycan/xylan/chitin deacetylase (PgdA/CDA1 family)
MSAQIASFTRILFLFALLHSPSHAAPFTVREGGIIRGPLEKKQLALVFTGQTYAERADTILDQLKLHHAQASFFLTGDFLANTNFRGIVQRLIKEQHYVGPHSDKHLLYCPWDGPKRTLISHKEFYDDLESNLKKLESLGLRRTNVRYFLPPFEHYNQQIVDWTAEMHMQVVNYSPGTRSNADYTGEGDKNFVSSSRIFDSIVEKERTDPHGLNGFILLLHVGAGPERQDKFASRFGELLDYLQKRGYAMVRVDTLLQSR